MEDRACGIGVCTTGTAKRCLGDGSGDDGKGAAELFTGTASIDVDAGGVGSAAEEEDGSDVLEGAAAME